MVLDTDSTNKSRTKSMAFRKSDFKEIRELERKIISNGSYEEKVLKIIPSKKNVKGTK